MVTFETVESGASAEVGFCAGAVPPPFWAQAASASVSNNQPRAKARFMRRSLGGPNLLAALDADGEFARAFADIGGRKLAAGRGRRIGDVARIEKAAHHRRFEREVDVLRNDA